MSESRWRQPDRRRLKAYMPALALGLAAVPALPQGNTWKDSPPLPAPRRLLATAAEGGLVYTFGGCGSPCFDPLLHPFIDEETRVEVFDPDTGSWSQRAPMPTPPFFGGAAVAPGNGRIYVVGGEVTGGVTAAYDPAADSWALRAPMPTPRHGLAAVALGGMVYAVGGSGPTGALEIYDPATDSWTAGAAMPTPRIYLAAAVAGGKLYAIGGSPDCCGGEVTDAVEVYDPATGTWQAVAPLPEARQGSAAVGIGGKIYSLGGFVPGSGTRGETFEYDPATDRWTALAPMPVPRDQAPAVVIDGQALVLGGSVDCHCDALSRVGCYIPPSPPLPKRADLEVRIAVATDGDGASALGGSLIGYRFNVTNQGPDAVTGARLDGVLPELEDTAAECLGSPGTPCPSFLTERAVSREFDLGAGESLTIGPFQGTVPCIGGSLDARVTVTVPPEVEDPDPTNNTAAASTAVVRTAHLEISVDREGEAEACPGETATYTIHLANQGPCPAEGATVDDVFPPGLTDVSWTCSPGPGAECCPGPHAGCCPGPGPECTGDLHDTVTLPAPEPGAPGHLTYHVRAVVAPDAAEPILNSALLTPPPGLAGAGPIFTLPARTGVQREMDLALTLAGEPDPVAPEDTVTYTLEVKNLGPCGLAVATVDDVFPPALTELSWTCSPGAGATCCPGPQAGCCSGEGTECTGDLHDTATLPGGGTVTYTAQGTLDCPTQGPLLRNEAMVTLDLPAFADPDGNNRAVSELPIQPRGLTAEKVITERDMSTITYEIRLHNHGPHFQGDNPGDEMADLFPAEVIVTGAAATTGVVVFAPHLVRWNGSIAVDGSVTLTVTGDLDPDIPKLTAVCNQAQVFFDSTGDGTNDAMAFSDAPGRPGCRDPTCFGPPIPGLEIPTLSPLGLAGLALLLAAAGLLTLRPLSSGR